MHLTVKEIWRILCAAIKSRLIIITDNDLEAASIRAQILGHARNFKPELSSTCNYQGTILIKGYEQIQVIGKARFGPSNFLGLKCNIYYLGEDPIAGLTVKSFHDLIGEPHGNAD